MLPGTTDLLAGPAAKRTPVITQRQVNQQAHIRQGIRSGELTRGEVRLLQREQAKIRCHKRIAKSDGVVTTWERKKLTREQNRANRHIYQAKHNGRVRY
ncbi:MAG: hypothetical protein JXQ27_03940 [Acidobacteria bacterium]|nr:hypothetical protein [Acidobacteriota bacterium]